MKSIAKPLFILPLLCSPFAYSDVINGDFEQWNGNTPTQWAVIDSGIAVSPTSNQVQSGGLAAQVVVNTGTQSNTDFLQTINVEQGKTYPFAVSVYHTEGNVKARLIVDGYHGYSNPKQTNQWQQLTHSYTASSNKTINVGLRFYDESGFDGSEVVYVDNFLPNQDGGGTQPPVESCNDNEIQLTLTTDSYGSETSWELKDSQSKVLFSGQGFDSSKTYEKTMCLTDGDYQFTINDSYGDGICCSSGNGSYALMLGQKTLASGGEFTKTQTTSFTLGEATTPPVVGEYYKAAEGKTGFALKTALFNIINNHTGRGYSAIWTLVKDADLDNYYEKDGTILDMYSEKPLGNDAVSFTKVTDQCGQYKAEGDCYNREHSFPKSWFGGKVEPMNSDGHHLFATDGYVNAKRSNWPFGEVGSSTYVSNNGSKLGSASASLGYSGTVFEPIDEFKGDFARAYFYMATRYENVIGNWEKNSSSSDAVLNGTSTTVFEPWMLNMLKRWHKNDPVSAKEINRNQQVFDFQGNRNPYIDHPEFVEMVWGN
ncbi:endonuclease [Vibrio harveyi]|uniref:endonuclease n=1 Tax=Vibrio harveyi TaxID=669 RepID=UPI002B3899B6|nr:endonuclease [Vibrio harveyi]HEQ3594187.1 endonuclease [Vibrio harveyi]HEQ3607557.1 endonuclease [Vibrio harveyi]